MSRAFWTAMGLALAFAVAAPAVAQDGEETKVRKIQIKKVVDCEDCDEQVSRVLFVGDDGDVRVLHGGDHEWVAEDGIRVIEGDGHEVIMIDEFGGVSDETGEVRRRVRHRVHQAMEQLGESGRRLHIRHGGATFLGVQLSDLTPELRTHFGVPDDAGVMVGKVVDDSPAFRAGLEVGDIVSAVDGEPVGSARSLSRAVRGHEDGETVVLEVWRDGQVQKISTTLERREPERRVEMSSAGAGAHEARVVEVKVSCDDGEDCTVDVDNTNSFDFAASACGDSGECEVKVECDDGDCACTVNGEAADCSAFPGLGQ